VDTAAVRTLLVGVLLGISASGFIAMLLSRSGSSNGARVTSKTDGVMVGLRGAGLARDVESKVSPADSADSPADTAPLISTKKDK